MNAQLMLMKHASQRKNPFVLDIHWTNNRSKQVLQNENKKVKLSKRKK
jgi:uncharacterized protein YydD (DUF2326 family)